jgi:uncharacterized protein YndB with AHSA1/START domain
MTTPARLWRALNDTSAFSDWWPWLELEPVPALRVGVGTTATIRPPLPYHLVVRLEVTEIVTEQRVVVSVSGDLHGRARMEITERADGSARVRLDFALEARRTGLRHLPGLADPLLRLGHRVVMARGITQFCGATGIEADRPGEDDPRWTDDPWRRGILAGSVAGALSGGPSTMHAVATGESPLTSIRAAGTLLGRSSLARGALAHTALSMAWGVLVTSAVRRSPRRDLPTAVALGACCGLAISAIDLGVVARRHYPEIAALPTGPQVWDHVVYGAVAGAVAAAGRHARRPGPGDPGPDVASGRGNTVLPHWFQDTTTGVDPPRA